MVEKPKSHSRLGVRKFLRNQLHILLYAIVHTIFSVYIRLRQAYHAVKDQILAILYYHHRTPELIQKDVKGLSRLPKHLSVILKLEDGGRGGAGLEALVDEVAEISAWCACVGIPMLSVYEQTGILKGYIPATHRAMSRKLSSYFGPQHHGISLRSPHMPSVESPATTPTSETHPAGARNLSVLLLSAEDGRDSLVDLTKTLAEMSQRSKLSSKDISLDLVDAEISESVVGEPDLLIGLKVEQVRNETPVASFDAMSLFRPPLVRSASATLNRALFSKTIPVAAARIQSVKNISKFRAQLQKTKELLILERLLIVRPDPDPTLAAKGGKCLLLKPHVKPTDPTTWSTELQESVKEEELQIVPYDLTLNYDYWTYHDVVTSLLPEDALGEVPVGFAIVGHIAHLNLKDEYLPYKNVIAQVLMDKNPNILTVINKTDDVGTLSEFRTFAYEVLAGVNKMKVEVSEADCTFRFDYSQVYWNTRLQTEHKRLVDSFNPGEVVCDVMAGVGPFAVPAGKKGVFVWANDLNPASYASMKDAIARNKVEHFVRPFCEDGHTFIHHAADDLLSLTAEGQNTVTIPSKQKHSRKGPPIPPPPKIITVPQTINHFVMNLPANAIDFLGSFNGLYHGHEALFVPNTEIKLPMIHVHCFSTKSDDNVKESVEICERITEKLGYEVKVGDKDLTIHELSERGNNNYG
ncbi:hypothetical protein G7Y89_g1556 [Cudoniella acicularis]|uniref:tRNA (guanine(37)-N1)-methyltransferase n=1 Tax=Cudoniella acicularis TaxID=354080 RepID=A0A8H4RXZ1_9HELO|nr:hypothetical protein G7Y89_g1556 [Cudoniella acicularis]